MILIQIFLVIIVADFVSGIGHWLEDRYANVSMTWIRDTIVLPNLEHHKTPRSFLERSYWSRNGYIIKVCLVMVSIIYLVVGSIAWQSLLFWSIISQINEVHALAHQSLQNTPKWVFWFNKVGLLQSKKHHNLHHASPYEVRYCILTNWLNPVLDYCHFFRGLEYLIWQIFGKKPNH